MTLPIEDYESDYLKSDHWSRVSASIRKRANGKCEQCGAPGKTEIHHNVYRRWRERPEDLIALCAKCHTLAHKGQGKDVDDILDYPEGDL